MTAATKVRPISFSGPMVLALLGRRKTQTRRVIKGEPESHVASVKTGEDFNGRFGVWFCCRGPQSLPASEHNYSTFIACPYGRPGDRLYVKEAFRLSGGGDRIRAVYRADNSVSPWRDHDGGIPNTRWQPSIFMPRWAARLYLEITGVRVERLQDITEEDAVAEGFDGRHLWASGAARCDKGGNLALNQFRDLWSDLNEQRGYPWESNPWVRVLSLRQVDDLSDLRAAGLSAWDDIEDPEAYLRGEAET